MSTLRHILALAADGGVFNVSQSRRPPVIATKTTDPSSSAEIHQERESSADLLQYANCQARRAELD